MPVEKSSDRSPRLSGPSPETDPTDLRILRMLQQDAKLTNKEIAARLGLSTTPVFERIRKLERSGVIRSYTALLNRELLGLHLLAFCNVSIKEHSRPYIRQFEREVLTLPEVVECFHTTGSFDYLLKVMVPDMSAYQRFLVEKLAALENIGRVESFFVMDEIRHDTALPV
jgi:Lrp/AsnC family leucine-responsive transcriptional regulator